MDDIDLLYDRTPWPNQHYGVAKAIESIEAKQSCCVTSPTGSGKTSMQVALIRWCAQTGRRVILYTNRIMLTEQTMRVLDAHNVEYGVIAATQKDRMALLRDVQLASIQTVNSRVNKSKRSELWKADVVIVDECFVAGTLVDGRPIESIRVGDTVKSYNHSTGQIELRRVTKTFQSTVDTITTLVFNDARKLECTNEHPIFSPADGRYIPAKHCNPRTEVLTDDGVQLQVHGMWMRFSDDPSEEECLEGALFNEVQEGHAVEDRIGYQQATRIRSNEEEESDARSRCEGEDAANDSENRTQAFSAGRQRTRDDEGRGEAVECPWLEADHRENRADWEIAVRASKSPEDRLGQLSPEDCHRDRRTHARLAFKEGAGSKEDCVSGVNRLDRDPIQEQGSLVFPDNVRRVCRVYNLEVEGNNNYFANGILVHNCHQLVVGASEKILRAHEEHGGVLVGFTATPLGLSHLYPHLIIAARNSDCRKFGALVPAKVYAPAEMNTASLKLQDNGEFSYEDIKREVFNVKTRNAIFGYVHDHWRRLNPDALPALGFAPGVAEAKWFVDQFAERGVRCASIDGEDCYIDGEEHKTSQGLRQEIVEEAKQGKVAIIWNRFVLREGIDFPWLHHLILATPIGSLTSYVQVVGRVLRFSEQTPSFVIIQDHGSSWWRHGSPNQDWDWERWYCANPSLPSRVRADAIRERREETAICCHKCGTVRASGLICPACGTQMNKKRRAVIQKDGTLKEMYGEPLPRKYVKEEPDTYTKWKSMVHRMRNADLTFAQAEGLFANENHYWPPPDLPMMPKLRIDKFQKIRKIPVDKLISVDEHVSMRVEAGKEPAKGVVERFKQERMF